MTFGDKLAGLLELRKWSRGKLAARSGLSRTYIGMIISGERDKVSLEAAARIAKALGVTLDFLADMPNTSEVKLSPDETEVISLYREAEPIQRRAVLAVLRED